MNEQRKAVVFVSAMNKVGSTLVVHCRTVRTEPAVRNVYYKINLFFNTVVHF